LVDGPLQGVRLERSLELGSVRLHVLDWPGHSGPLLYVPGPFVRDEDIASRIAAEFAPAWRVVRIEPRQDVPYQVQVDDVRRAMQQFGFGATVVLSSAYGTCIVLPLAAWYPRLARAVVLIDPIYAPPTCDGIAARSLRECPPDWIVLQNQIQCSVRTTSANQVVSDLRELL
jgi:pimeloyl-ACP methyl ester carboxylesterase